MNFQYLVGQELEKAIEYLRDHQISHYHIKEMNPPFETTKEGRMMVVGVKSEEETISLIVTNEIRERILQPKIKKGD